MASIWPENNPSNGLISPPLSITPPLAPPKKSMIQTPGTAAEGKTPKRGVEKKPLTIINPPLWPGLLVILKILGMLQNFKGEKGFPGN